MKKPGHKDDKADNSNDPDHDENDKLGNICK
jgi:hypothetical protein